jgi:hypothetical protein
MGLVRVCQFWEALMGMRSEVKLQGDIAQVCEAVKHTLGQIAAEQASPGTQQGSSVGWFVPVWRSWPWRA